MNHYFNNNQLLSGYQNYQRNNVPFQNNKLLQNNMMFQNSMNYNNSGQVRAMQQMQEQMAKLRQLQKIKQTERLNELDSIIDKDKIRESVIKPLKEPKIAAKEMDTLWIAKQNNLVPEKQEYWRARTNQPYKNILKNIDYSKLRLTDDEIKELQKNSDYTKFYQRLGINGKDLLDEDLVIHKTTDVDRLEERLMAEFKELSEMIEMHNDELKIIYSLSEKSAHKKKFEYVHVNKYEKIKYDPADFSDMKKDKIEIFKREQEKIEKDKKKMEDILENLVNKGVISEQDVKLISEQDHEQSQNDDDFDLDKLEQQLLNEISEEDIKLLKEETKTKTSQNNSKIIKNENDTTAKPKAKLVKKSISANETVDNRTQSTNLIDAEHKPKARLVKKSVEVQLDNDSPNANINSEKPKARLISKKQKAVEETISAAVSDDIINKYEQRQKK